MTQMISVKPSEKGTAKVTIAPVDEEGTDLTLTQLKTPQWQLMKTDGTIVNNRDFASCPISALSWALTGDDLVLFTSDNHKRILSIQALYDSNLGNDLHLTAEFMFEIDPLYGQVNES